MSNYTTTQTVLTLVGAALLLMLGLNILLLAEIATAVGASPPAETIILGVKLAVGLVVFAALLPVIANGKAVFNGLRRWYDG